MDKYLTVKDVATMLKMSKAKVYLLAQRKKIPHIKIDRNVRIRESDLVRWLEQKTLKPK